MFRRSGILLILCIAVPMLFISGCFVRKEAPAEESSDSSVEINEDYIIRIIPEDYVPREEIRDDYIAVFHGGSGELTFDTYIYKIDTGHANAGFEYINAESYGMTANQTVKILEVGTVLWTEDVFPVAEANNAYSFVTLPGDTDTYTIDEFKDMFIMN